MKDILQPGVTVRDLVVAHDTKLLTDWDHTANLQAQIYNLTVVVLGFGGKSRSKPKSALHFHPYRERKIEGMKVSAKNIGVLKLLAACLAKK